MIKMKSKEIYKQDLQKQRNERKKGGKRRHRSESWEDHPLLGKTAQSSMMLKWPNDFYHVTPTHQHHLGAVCPYLKIGTKKIKVKKGKKEPKKEKICTNKNADSKDNLKKMIRWEIDLLVCA